MFVTSASRFGTPAPLSPGPQAPGTPARIREARPLCREGTWPSLRELRSRREIWVSFSQWLIWSRTWGIQISGLWFSPLTLHECHWGNFYIDANAGASLPQAKDPPWQLGKSPLGSLIFRQG